MLVCIKYDCFFSQLHFNRNDFVLETSGINSSDSLLLRSITECILHFTCDIVFLGNVLCRNTHVDTVHSICQGIIDHMVYTLEISHFVSCTCICRNQVRSTGHGFHTTGNDNVIKSCLNGHNTLHNGTKSGTTYHVHGV